MNRGAWLNRVCVVASLVGLGLAVSSAFGIASDLAEVAAARNGLVAASMPAPVPSTSSSRWTEPTPALRIENGDPRALIGEFFNGTLGGLGLLITSTDITTISPLGNGLKLAEVTIRAKGKLEGAADVSNWIAVNREALRLKSMTVTATEQGEAQLTLVILMVIA